MMVDHPHPILVILQLHATFVRMANYLRGNTKPSQPV